MKTIPAAAFACCLLLSRVSAFAQSAVTTAPTTGHPTAILAVSGNSFGASEAVDVYVDTVDTLLLVSRPTGTISGSLTIPASASPGQHFVTAIGRRSGDAAQVAFTVSTPWVEFGFGAAHLGLNPFENTVSPENVGSLGPVWDAATNSLGGTPVVGVGKVFVSSNSGFQALSASTGSVIWTSKAVGGFYASPALSDGTVYVGATSGNFYALSAAKGAIKWTTPVGGDVVSSAVVVDGVVYFGCADHNVYALNAATGAILWTFATGDEIESSPAVVNGVLYIGSIDTYVYAINAATGTLIWKYLTNGIVEGSPAVSKGVVYIGSDNGNVYAIRAKGLNAGSLLWVYTTGAPVYQAPAVASNTVFIGSQDGNLYALNAATGSVQWTVATNGIVGNAVVANGVVYMTARDGSLYAVDASYGGVLALFETGWSYLGTPSISDGILYLSTYNSDTFAFAVGAGTQSKLRLPPNPNTLHPNFELAVTGQ